MSGSDEAAQKACRAPTVRASLSSAENALVCYLREHKNKAAEYGIKICGGNTSAGSMLLQVLHGAGMHIEWYEQLPNGAVQDSSTANEKAAAYIKKIGVRPGAKTKQLNQMPEVLPPDNSAILRHKGRLPRASFPLFKKLSETKRYSITTTCGNRVLPPAAAALVDRCQMVNFVEKQLRCECGARLCFVPRASHQVAACAKWTFVCTKSCKPRELLTSPKMHIDDYELNSKINCAIITCALSFARMQPFFDLVGLVAPSTVDHYACKAEAEPLLSEMAELSMAEAHAQNVAKGHRDYVAVDGGYTAPRHAHGCTMPAMAADGRVVAVVHKRCVRASPSF